MNKEKTNKITDISERVSEILTHTGDTRNSFAVKLGYERAQTVYDILNSKNAPSYDFFRKFQLSEFSDIIETDWLLTGRGSMLKEERTEKPEINYAYKGAPYYNVDFIGGFDMVLNDHTINPDYYINFEPYNKEGVVWCNLTGHSMEPELNNGDFIAMKEMSTPVDYLPFGEVYGIVTDDYRTIKRISKSGKEGFIKLIPTNKNPEYCEQDIPISMIRKVFAVLGSMHRLF